MTKSMASDSFKTNGRFMIGKVSAPSSPAGSAGRSPKPVPPLKLDQARNMLSKSAI